MLKNLKREQFCNEYLVDFNAKQSAIRAGYSTTSASVMGHNLLKEPEVQNRIKELQSKLSEKTQISAEKVIAEFAAIAFSDIRDYLKEDLTFKKLSDIKNTRVISSIEVNEVTFGENGKKKQVKFRLYNKLDALESLGKYLNLFGENEKQADYGESLKDLADAIRQSDTKKA